MRKKKICIVTGARAEYGLLYPLLKELKRDKGFQLQLVATGMHLSPEFGLTYREIEKDGFHIDETVEMLLSSDSGVGIAKSIGLGISGLADAFQRLRPDMLVVLGDRFEALAAAVAAMTAGIPIAHISGGEKTEGAIDEAIRHSITKMSHIHFPAADEYRRRVIQLGEQPDKVFNVGELALDNIRGMRFLSRNKFEKAINFTLKKTNILVTFHSATLDKNASGRQFNALLSRIDGLKDVGVIFTKPNADAYGRIIIRLIDDYVRNRPEKAAAFASMGRVLYLNALRRADAVVGNSSSGIVEAPSFGIPTVNIGDRQRGRLRASSVIDCAPDKKSIQSALEKALSGEFRQACRKTVNPYGKGDAAKNIMAVLRSLSPARGLLKKRFYDIADLERTWKN